MRAMETLAHAIVLQWGWKRRMLAFGAGAMSVAAMQPIGFFPILALTLPVMVWLLDGTAAAGGRSTLRGLWSAFGIGWWFGFGYMLVGLWWLGLAFFVDAGPFIWMMPLAVVALPAALALFYAFGFALASRLWSQSGLRIFALAFGLACSEWVRGHALTGFPWNTLGYAITNHLPMAQTLAYTGLWGATLLVVLTLASPALLAATESKKKHFILPLISLALWAGAFGFGTYRLEQMPQDMVPGIKLRIMQPNIQQDEKFRPEAKADILEHYAKLSLKKNTDGTGLADVTHLIWPESAFPFVLSKDREALAFLAEMLPTGVTLVTGAIRVEEPINSSEKRKVFNSIYAMGDDGTFLATYDKVHLVPFGEYLPFQELLESWGFEQFTKIRGGFTKGRKHEAMQIPLLPLASPLICYEAIFPGEVMPEGQRARVAINLTNDGWFGRSPGPYQHLQQVISRAIEQGIPVIRAANTGISAVISGNGHIVQKLSLDKADVMDVSLPKALAQTHYGRYGDWNFVALLIFSFSVAYISKRKFQ
jgi:apolipoprotein N-acyltransferase